MTANWTVSRLLKCWFFQNKQNITLSYCQHMYWTVLMLSLAWNPLTLLIIANCKNSNISFKKIPYIFNGSSVSVTVICQKYVQCQTNGTLFLPSFSCQQFLTYKNDAKIESYFLSSCLEVSIHFRPWACIKQILHENYDIYKNSYVSKPSVWN
jgi:hypothetical protein